MEFVTQGYADHYEALRVTLLDKDNGRTDVSTLRFTELWGEKPISNTTGNSLKPHLWDYRGKLEWYMYEPTTKEAKILCGQLNDYLAVFEPSYGQVQQHEPEVGWQ